MRIGRSSSGFSERTRSALILLLFTCLMAASGWLWRWDLLLYDLQMGVMTRPPADDVVIVAVDEKSLEALGRWPWSRQVHAELVDRLTQAGARAIVLDILFAESDRIDPEADIQLIQSIAASERVFMPVIPEQHRQDDMPVESMPLPALSNVAAGLGHVHMDLDADGIARGVFLYEGLGQAYWPHLMLTLLNWLQPEEGRLQSTPVSMQAPSTHLIGRHTHRLIPFSGPAGHYHRYSYSQILEGDFPPDLFRDRIVLVGITATGIGDALPTPVSGHGVLMPGVEINANILDSLRRDETITPVGYLPHLSASALIVVLPFVLYPYFPTRSAPLVSLALVVGFLFINWILLRGAEIWFPPSAGLLGLMLSYPLWSWRRLDQAVRYLNEQLESMQLEQRLLPVQQPPDDMTSAMAFLSRLLPLQGWVLYDAGSGKQLLQDGEPLGAPLDFLTQGAWQRSGAEIWILIQRSETGWQLGLVWPRNAVPQGRSLQVVTDFALQFSFKPQEKRGSVLERVELRMQQMRETNTHLQRFRNLIGNAVEQMDDGLMVINSLGQVVMSNPRASFYLGHGSDRELWGEDAYRLLKALEMPGGEQWREVFRKVMLHGEPIRFEAFRSPDTELFVQLKSLDGLDAGMHGMIVNLSYIGTIKRSERTRAKMLNFLSHDIRSPITSLLSLTQSRQMREGSAKELAEQIEPLARRSLKLAGNFLRLARAEAAEATSFTDTDFVTVAHNAMDESYVQAKSRRITLQRRFEEDEIWLQGDPGLLERALLNLLENAVKFSPEQGQVSMTLRLQGSELVCEIADQGPGIPRDQLNSIFLPFTQAESIDASQGRGMGLGLSFVKVVAEKHHGSVVAKNAESGGAVFSLSLPCEEKAPALKSG
ncbi:MAG: CHASE2 domain-containing protein [Candidatus Thiodiazotropha sp. (ex Epidulcina cf. delphinae)]|nr:CHASE2 domain-containing protein [Candidatus Thiodiazotropha sp. (ex Epidulcina cf. delphinae)]